MLTFLHTPSFVKRVKREMLFLASPRSALPSWEWASVLQLTYTSVSGFCWLSIISFFVDSYNLTRWIYGNKNSGTLHNPENAHVSAYMGIHTVLGLLMGCSCTLKHVHAVNQMEQPTSSWASLMTAEQLEVYRSGRPQHTHTINHHTWWYTHIHTNRQISSHSLVAADFIELRRKVSHEQSCSQFPLLFYQRCNQSFV